MSPEQEKAKFDKMLRAMTKAVGHRHMRVVGVGTHFGTEAFTFGADMAVTIRYRGREFHAPFVTERDTDILLFPVFAGHWAMLTSQELAQHLDSRIARMQAEERAAYAILHMNVELAL